MIQTNQIELGSAGPNLEIPPQLVQEILSNAAFHGVGFPEGIPVRYKNVLAGIYGLRQYRAAALEDKILITRVPQLDTYPGIEALVFSHVHTDPLTEQPRPIHTSIGYGPQADLLKHIKMQPGLAGQLIQEITRTPIAASSVVLLNPQDRNSKAEILKIFGYRRGGDLIS